MFFLNPAIAALGPSRIHVLDGLSLSLSRFGGGLVLLTYCRDRRIIFRYKISLAHCRDLFRALDRLSDNSACHEILVFGRIVIELRKFDEIVEAGVSYARRRTTMTGSLSQLRSACLRYRACRDRGLAGRWPQLMQRLMGLAPLLRRGNPRQPRWEI